MPLWEWHGPLVAVQGAVWAVALAIGYLSFRSISIRHFLGLTAVGQGKGRRRPSDRLITTGIYGEVRNPQFLSGLLLLWARDLTRTGLVVSVILSLYMLIATRIEEKRLLRKFGDEYARYMAKVPRFIPRRFPSPQSLFRVQDR